MKGLYDVARHLVWLTQFGLSVVVPPTLCIAGSGCGIGSHWAAGS